MLKTKNVLQQCDVNDEPTKMICNNRLYYWSFLQIEYFEQLRPDLYLHIIKYITE